MPAGPAHGLAALYLGFSVVFGAIALVGPVGSAPLRARLPRLAVMLSVWLVGWPL